MIVKGLIGNRVTVWETPGPVKAKDTNETFEDVTPQKQINFFSAAGDAVQLFVGCTDDGSPPNSDVVFHHIFVDVNGQRAESWSAIFQKGKETSAGDRSQAPVSLS